MLIWIAAAAAAGLALLSLRSMAAAFGSSIGPVAAHPAEGFFPEPKVRKASSRLGAGEVPMLILEIAFSIGISLMILGLAFTASLPLHLIAGALLSQVAVSGALFGPTVNYELNTYSIRPAAIALGIAQLAQFGFFVYTMQALLG